VVTPFKFWVLPNMTLKSTTQQRSFMNSSRCLYVSLALCAMISFQEVVAQTTVTITSMADASIRHEYGSPQNNNNYGAHQIITAEHDLNGVLDYTWKTLIAPDLSSLPPNIIVTSAILHLTGVSHNAPNELSVSKIIGPWTENGVTWNTQPPVIGNGGIILPSTITPDQNDQIDITHFVNQWLIDPSTHHGIMLSLSSPTLGTLRSYGSTNSTLPPSLEVTYYPIETQVARLNKQLDGELFHANDGMLYFEYNEQYHVPSQLLDFSIYDDSHAEVISNSSLPINLRLSTIYGLNTYALNLFDCNVTSGGQLPAGEYILVVRNEKKEHWKLRFEIGISPNGCP